MSSVLEKAPSPSPSPTPRASDPVRFAPIRANLMPPEVLGARHAAVLRKRVLIGLAALVVALVGFYGLSWWQTHAARNDLAAVQRQGVTLQNQTQQFAPLVNAEAATTSIQSQLQKLMVGDLSWKNMLSTLRSKAPAGVQLTQVGGNVTTGAAGADQAAAPGAAGGFPSLNQSGKQQVGTLTLAGTANDQRSVADYSDTLATIKGLASPFITNVTTTGKSITFGITVLVTSDALGGRYQASTTSQTGASAPTAPTAPTGGN